jgi:hypothetical protein
VVTLSKVEEKAAEILKDWEDIPQSVTSSDWYQLLDLVQKGVELAELVQEEG